MILWNGELWNEWVIGKDYVEVVIDWRWDCEGGSEVEKVVGWIVWMVL